MSRRILVFDDPDRFAAGAIGRPGQRTFFLQVVDGRRIASVVLEKVQVALLADRIAAILAELRLREVTGAPEEDADELPNDDDRPLDEWVAFQTELQEHFYGKGAADLPGGSTGS